MRPQFVSLGSKRPTFKVVYNPLTGKKFTVVTGLVRIDVSGEWQYLEGRRVNGTVRQIPLVQSAGWKPFMENCNPTWRAPSQLDISKIALRLRAQ